MDDQKIELCKYIQNNIHKLCQAEIDEIFKILYKNNSTYTQNNNGIFVNLNWVEYDILLQIHTYINFCLTSQTEINKYELIKNMITDSIINKEKIDDKIVVTSQSSNIVNINIKNNNKISSSMKFYLLKKKFLKKNNIHNNNINNILTHEEYLTN
jgi:uncharacterized linocin/CFP29 family protein